jgi:hypothetical protein
VAYEGEGLRGGDVEAGGEDRLFGEIEVARHFGAGFGEEETSAHRDAQLSSRARGCDAPDMGNRLPSFAASRARRPRAAETGSRPHGVENRFGAASRTDLATPLLGLLRRGIAMTIQHTVLLGALTTGLLIGCAPQQASLPYAPVFNTGAKATIIMPGQNAPPMPGQGSSVTKIGPGSYSGSSSGSYPGQAGGAPPPGTPPSAYTNPGDLTMFGGAVTVDTREIKSPRSGLRSNPLLWPFAIVAWPFQKVADAIGSNANGESWSPRPPGSGRRPRC